LANAEARFRTHVTYQYDASDSLANILAELLAQYEERAPVIGIAASKHVREHFSAGAYVKGFRALTTQIMSAKLTGVRMTHPNKQRQSDGDRMKRWLKPYILVDSKTGQILIFLSYRIQ
jgi:hypothetical protein